MSKERLGEIKVMSNREWLEDKKVQLKNATVFTNENGNEAVEISLTVLNRLIEQAERAEYNNIWAERVRKYKEQNKRYREALKQISQYGDIYSWQASQARKALEESE